MIGLSREYIDQALRSEVPKTELLGDRTFTALSIEVLIAAAELADLLKKQIIYGKRIPNSEFESAYEMLQDTLNDARDDCGRDHVLEVLTLQPRLTHSAIGIFGEAGELLNALQVAEDNGILDVVNVAEELGDVQWYLAVGLDEVDEVGIASPDHVAEMNIEKLRRRFPDKFTLEASENRDVDAERAALEGSA
jgi:NTP pyrophosphatase (non-canonical NTP hydrolase)